MMNGVMRMTWMMEARVCPIRILSQEQEIIMMVSLSWLGTMWTYQPIYKVMEIQMMIMEISMKNMMSHNYQEKGVDEVNNNAVEQHMVTEDTYGDGADKDEEDKETDE